MARGVPRGGAWAQVHVGRQTQPGNISRMLSLHFVHATQFSREQQLAVLLSLSEHCCCHLFRPPLIKWAG